MTNKSLRSYIIFVTLFSLLFFVPPAVLSGDYDSFSVIGDTRIGLREDVYREILSMLDRMGVTNLFIVGDVIHEAGTEEQWALFLKLTGKSRTFHIAPGNHDINNSRSLDIYKKYIKNPPYFSFSSGSTQFIILSSEMPGEVSKITGQQIVWLQKELQKPFQLRIIFIHQPLFPSTFGGHYGLHRFPKDRDILHALLVKNKVNIVFQGHEHLYNRSSRDGITYVITGGGGAPLQTTNKEYGGFFHYILAKRLNDGYLFTVFDLKGNKRDEFSIF